MTIIIALYKTGPSTPVITFDQKQKLQSSPLTQKKTSCGDDPVKNMLKQWPQGASVVVMTIIGGVGGMKSK